MADHIKFAVSATPIEELVQEAGLATTSIIASEVGTSLSGSGESYDVNNYSGTLIQQGYKDGAVGYLDATNTAGGVALTNRSQGTFFFIRNTGYKYSSATVLGSPTTDCVMVVVRVTAQSAGNGGWEKKDGHSQIHFLEVAWLKPGQAIVLPGGSAVVDTPIVTFGDNTNDLTSLNENAGVDTEETKIYVRTFGNEGSEALDGNAVEFLAVT